MVFEYDVNKSLSNKEKYGIDFKEGKDIWEDDNLAIVDLKSETEKRHLAIGRLNNCFWSVIFTTRNKNIRIISIRRSRENEVLIYEG